MLESVAVALLYLLTPALMITVIHRLTRHVGIMEEDQRDIIKDSQTRERLGSTLTGGSTEKAWAEGRITPSRSEDFCNKIIYITRL